MPFNPNPRAVTPPAPTTTTPSDLEEEALMRVIRIVRRAFEGAGTPTDVELAFVGGAEVIFDRLAAQCRGLLARLEEKSPKPRSNALGRTPKKSARSGPAKAKAARTPKSS